MDEDKNKVNPTPEEINAKLKEETKKVEDQSEESAKDDSGVRDENRRAHSNKGFNIDDIQGEDVSGEYSDDDIFKNKTMSALAYIIFFIPLIAAPDSKFGKFHANQGLVLLITGFIGSFVLGIIPIIGWILLPVFSLAVFVIAVMAIVNTLNGKAKKLPFIGDINLINK